MEYVKYYNIEQNWLKSLESRNRNKCNSPPSCLYADSFI